MDIQILGFTMSLTWFLVLLCFIIYLAVDAWSHSYWRRRGLTHEPAWPVIANMPDFAAGIPDVFNKMQAKHGKVYGMFSFQKPLIVIADPDMLRQVMVKSFYQFHDRIDFPQNNKEMRSGLANMEGERWRDVRNLLTPTFSGAKMKQMAALVNRSADRLIDHITRTQKEKGHIECRERFGAFVMDTIGSCAFGLDIDSQSNPDHPFVAHAKRAFDVDVNGPLFVLGSIIPPLGQLLAYFELGLFFPKDVMAFFRNVTMKAVALRKSITQESTKQRVDFLQLMVDAQKDDKPRADTEIEAEVEPDVHDDLDHGSDVVFNATSRGKNVQLTDDELVGSAVTFFTAGYDTTNTLISFIFYLLSTNPDCQEKLVQEVDEKMPTRESVGYSSFATMPYLDKVVCETLRIYPPAVILNRVCNEEFTFNDVTIEKGVLIFIPVYTIHHDPEYWPNPDQFDPERFSKANREARHPFAWLPFGAGPHNCIGMRFALMETKMAVVRVLQKFRFETCPETEIPPKFGKKGFLSPPNGVTLRAIPRTDAVE